MATIKGVKPIKRKQTSVKIADELAKRVEAVVSKFEGVTMSQIINAGIERVLPEFENGKVTLRRTVR